MGGDGGTALYAVDADDRMLDPIVLTKIPAGKNLTTTTSPIHMQQFNALWAKVAAARAAIPKTAPCSPGNFPCTPAGPSPSNVSAWWTEWKAFAPAGVQIGSLRPGQCADVDKCVGLNGDGHCVCNS